MQTVVALALMALSSVHLLRAMAVAAQRKPAWIAVNATVVLVGLVAIVWYADWAGYLVVAVFLPLVQLPILLAQRMATLMAQDRPRAAARVAHLLSWVAPWAVHRHMAALYHALDSADARSTLAELERLDDGSDPTLRIGMRLVRGRLLADWADVLRLCEANADPTLFAMQVRALGELGRVPDMLQLYRDRSGTVPASLHDQAHLPLMAFSGRVDAVERLLSRASLQADTNSYWRAVARLSDGAADGAARAELTRLATDGVRAQTRAIARAFLDRLMPPDAPRPSPDDLALLAAIDADATHAATARPRPLLACPATLAVLGLNLAVAAWQFVSGRPSDWSDLIALGALDAELVLQDGDWWRLITYAGLHIGVLHLAMNSLVLSVVGPPIETWLGGWRFLLSYVALAILAGLGTVWMMSLGVVDHSLVVGASGAIMGLIGMECMLVLARYRQTRRAEDARALAHLGMIVAIQMLIDAVVPFISSAAHIWGVLAGLALGALWAFAAGVPLDRAGTTR